MFKKYLNNSHIKINIKCHFNRLDTLFTSQALFSHGLFTQRTQDIYFQKENTA